MICPACGADASGNYCPNCGQHMGPRVLSLRTQLAEVLEDQFNLDAKLPRTLALLFVKPGFLTREYVRQRISPYIPPFRLYLGISVLFFLVVTLQTTTQPLELPDRALVDSLRAVVRDSANARLARGERPSARFGVSIDPFDPHWAENAQINLGSDRLNRALKEHLLTLRDVPAGEAIRRLLQGILQDAPKVMFVLLPLYALLLKLLYVRRYYVEHFVFALHVHAFAFGLFLIMFLLRFIPFLPLFLFAWLAAYFLVAMKRVYEQSWAWTIVKWAVLGQAYLVLVALGMAAAFAAAVLTL